MERLVKAHNRYHLNGAKTEVYVRYALTLLISSIEPQLNVLKIDHYYFFYQRFNFDESFFFFCYSFPLGLEQSQQNV
ncbi:CLUMA_CG002050, isoform A [Clunio marinus]|uniref:CLUMA_CG002050, isoform A n=1 Tax=Clunio marinus TaxID=568069 RepID=A0A1J1HP69_9DIPT|nr:CLUMA_CG002050, isoform A [Clunio marinus]